MLALLRGPFGLLWAGQSVSLLGDGVFLVALTWQLAVAWHRPALLGGALAARVLAELVALALGGWLVDRLRRRTVVLAADAGRAMVLFALVPTLSQGGPRGGTPGGVTALALELAAFGLLTGMFRPALVAWVPELVTHDGLAAANAAVTISAQASFIAGPAIGTALLGLGSVRIALAVDGLSFLVAAACSVPLPSRAAPSGRANPLALTAEGFRTVASAGWLGGTILLVSLVNLGTITAQRLALPRAAADHYGRLGGYGAVLVAMGAGALLAAALLARLLAPRQPGRVAYLGILLFALATVGLGLVHGVVAAVLLGLAFGFGQQLFELQWTTGLQRNVPGRLIGRASAVEQLGSFLFLPLSFLLGGLVAQVLGPETVMIAAGLTSAGLALVGMALPALHRWRPLEQPAPAAPARAVPLGQPAATRRQAG